MGYIDREVVQGGGKLFAQGTGELYCISGIDTDIGKTVVTGLLAKFLLNRGKRVITQKMCQTGCSGISEDIISHRRIMGTSLNADDMSGATCPYIFPVPCSPHLAASLAGAEIDVDRIVSATRALQKRYDIVLLEGVGGLMVPLTADLLLVDFMKTLPCRHILVTSPRLGSINHTLASLEIMRSRGLDLMGLVYNRFVATAADSVMIEDSKQVFCRYLKQYGFAQTLIEVQEGDVDCDFSPLFQMKQGGEEVDH